MILSKMTLCEPTRVKICGIQRLEDAMVAVDAGADFVGFVFWPSRRYVEPFRAREIIAAVHDRRMILSKSQDDPVQPACAVGVFVDEDPTEMNRLARLCRLDYVQLSGTEPDEMIASLEVPAIQVFHVDSEGASHERLAERVAATAAELVLLDTARRNLPGGTGVTFDWSRVPPVSRNIMLAGGLHAGNVAKAIGTVGPWGVDVSSGVETHGVKDAAKIVEFIATAKKGVRN
jgi:phosphoribosylanthranilate isomerase